MTLEWILIAVIIVLSGTLQFFTLKSKKKEELVAIVKQEALQLFLYAEKQEWIGPKKMEWVAEELANHVPSNVLKQVIGKDQINTWLQNLYDEFKKNLSK